MLVKTCLFSNIFAKQPLEEAMDAASRFGYAGVELLVGWGANHLEPDMPAARVKEIRRMADDKGLSVAGIYTNLGGHAHLGVAGPESRAELDTLKVFCEQANVLGCGVVKVGAGSRNEEHNTETAFGHAGDWLRRASETVQPYNVRSAVEIHFRQQVETAEQALAMATRVAHPNFGIIHDAGNLFIAGCDWGASTVELLGKHIVHVHIKDVKESAAAGMFKYRDKQFQGAFLGEGDVDHGPVLGALRRLGYQGFLSCECMRKDKPWETAEHEAMALGRLLADTRVVRAGEE
ncbi:MAG: hypothetical protein A3K19_02010 [Lentisphaerae bacterium RIFOXYB12_FULL_65_16]|nr:MAG: hypothetical protein A3K18_29385 [Lentisphaerae bacterium RIFOXYA12_64_32]OGV92652.1 MAG: hypothetical protein A3K19_02010 [Lentisphaerae bacterium RIFOXYB12_FULL_65_16]